MGEYKLTFTDEQRRTISEVVRALREDYEEVDAATDEAECVTIALHDWVTTGQNSPLFQGRPDAGPAPVSLTVEQWGNVLARILEEYGRDRVCGHDIYIDPDRIETIIREEVERG